ncbi:toll-like receptor 4 [Ylistrum balloti]|uniref:toll-like receptor 4 n=1 Tax=Ylistrum balloti TaxID=509963 RepID=UPI002905A003|nr:toll-like receptor 4 [Ylistrum balloti]
MDLQCVLLSPRLQASALYYKTKLACHNFTLYDLATKDVTCYFWHEGEGDLTGNSFASCIVHFIEDMLAQSDKEIKTVVLYSDGCTYQNRNTVLANALSKLAKERGLTILQKYLEKGHTQMEVDSVHSTIESKLKRKPIYVPQNYVDIIKSVRPSQPYHVHYVDHTFFKNFSHINLYSSIRPGTKVGDPVVTDIRVLEYSPHCGIRYKLMYDQEFCDFPRKAKLNEQATPEMTVAPLHATQCKVKESKYKHLQELKNVIPRDFHPFYDILKSLNFLLLGLQITAAMKPQSITFNNINRCTSEPKCRCFVVNEDVRSGDLAHLGADCSRKGLSNVPVFSPDVTWISLSDNNLSAFPNASDIGNNVKFLDLSHNKLRSFRKDTLQRLTDLITLNISNNQLSYNTSIFKPGIFESLSKLQFLNLKHNVHEENTEYPQCIRELTSLETLHLDGIDGADFPMSNLTTLDFTSLQGGCKIRSLAQTMFVGVPMIQYLDLAFCNLTRIEKGALGVLNRLKYLNVSHNVYLSFSVLSNLTFNLQCTDIRTIDASKIHCTYGVGTNVVTDDLKYLKNTTLENLYFDSNRLNLIQLGVVDCLPPTLRYISGRDNMYTLGTYLFQLADLNNVRKLDISYSFTTHAPSITTNRFLSCNDWRGPVKDESEVMPSNDMMKKLTLERLGSKEKGMIFIFNLPRNLEIASFANCYYRYIIVSLHFSKNRLTHIFAQNNLFTEWRGPIFNLTKLEYVDLSNNFCSYVSKEFFQYAPSLKTLIINTNLLGFMMNQDTYGETFKNNILLTKLDMSMNRIDMLSHKIFHTLVNMKYLNLSFNLMTSLEIDISHMRNLTNFDLSHNQLSELTNQNRQHIDAITKTGNLMVDLSNNRFVCSCQTLPFLHWINLNQKIFRGFQTYRCSLDNKTSVLFSELDSVLQQLEKDCTSYIGLIAGLLSAIVFCIAIVVLGLVYRYRWKLRYLYYITKNKYRGYATIRDDHNHEYRYDAFISYAAEESEFIKKDLIKNLEENRPFRLCIHERDFTPGMDIAANITDAIHSSRKTVVIMSENFVESYWCMYELNMARMESIYSREGASVLFLVMFSHVPIDAIPLQVIDVIRSKTYIEYPNDPQGNVVFWDRVVEAISK